MKTRNFKAIKMLIEKNASLSLKNKQNKTAIDLALDEDLKNFIQEIQNQKKVKLKTKIYVFSRGLKKDIFFYFR